LSRIIARSLDSFVTDSANATVDFRAETITLCRPASRLWTAPVVSFARLCTDALTESVHSRSQVRRPDVDDERKPVTSMENAMISITSVSITQPVTTTSSKAAASTDDTSVTASTEASSDDTTKVSANGAPAASGGSSSSSEESDSVKALRKQIAELQKQLQEQQQQLQAAQAKQESADAKAADVAAAQSQIATTAGSLQTATAALLAALQEEGSSTSGTMVSTSA
jgi:hypothetical protein